MDEGRGWLRAHYRTAVVLVLIFGLALFLRLYFVYGLAFTVSASTCTDIYTPPFSGGSDSYYWDRTLCYAFQTGRDLGTDPMTNYPLTMQNPRPPLFPWFSLLNGRLLAPFFDSAWHSVLFVFLLSTGLFGALTVFPTYALAKEAFGRKAGIISAFLLATSVGHLQRSASSDADHDAFTLFFVVTTFYFFLRSLKTLNRRRWVESWFRRDSITTGIRAFLRENRPSLLYALFAGLSVTVIALAWQGWAYVAVILLVWFGVELFLDRFRNEDTMGTWLLFAIVLATPLFLAFQWYFVRSQIRVWFDVPAYLFVAAFVLGLAFTVTRDYPWTLVIPSTLIAAAIGLTVGVVVNPALSSAFFSGAGYFIQTKVVTTIAEAQAPGMSQIILSFGMTTFGLSLAAVAYLLWQLPRRRDPSYAIVVIWAFAAIFMAITAARFIFNASPAFAISAGFAIDQILRRADFATMRRTYRSLAAGSWRNAFRKSVKMRHIFSVLGIVFLVLLPNVWFAVDASIPFDLKGRYDRQVADALPAFLRAPGSDPEGRAPFYFGAFGYSIPRETEYFPAAWEWFATQDADRPPELRPAFLSWWDYGFEAVDRGAHPTVADNFQNGYPFAGQFLTAQNETHGIALLAIRLLEGDFRHSRQAFRPSVASILEARGLPVETFRAVFLRPQDYVSAVLSDPVTYGVWDENMNPFNAQYIVLASVITRQLGEEGVVSLYRALRDATGWSIGYFAVDSRLFPLSAQNTGIFYAPVQLSDHRVLELPDGRVLPLEFFQITANTNRRQNIPIQSVQPDEQIQSQTIQYQPGFYNSMFYRAYVGYSPRDLGDRNSTGIPGFDPNLQGSLPNPAWNLTHWRVAYRTAYYNPFTDVGNHSDAWQALNYDEAQRIDADIRAGSRQGVVDVNTISAVANGVVFLRYYDGAWVNGTVRAGSTLLPGVRITAIDELGTPHYVTTTDAQGRYSALVPFGDVTIIASIGNVTTGRLTGPRTLGTVTVPVTVDQAMRVPADSNGDTIPDWIMTRDLQVDPRVAEGDLFYDLDRDGSFGAGDVTSPGATITITHKEFPYSRSATAGPGGSYSIGNLPVGTYSVTVAVGGRAVRASDISISATSARHDIGLPFAVLRGLTTSSGEIISAAIELRDETNATVIPVTSGANGEYLVRPLLAGNYTVTASSGDLASTPERVRLRGTDVWLNLTLAPSGTVIGTTTVFGTTRPFATIAFQSAADPRIVRTTTSDAGARYAIRLAAGEWFVNGRIYDSTGLYATLGRVSVAAGTAATHDPMFLQGARVVGTVTGPEPGVVAQQADVAFSTPAGRWWLRTDSFGGYLAFLPVGTYDVQAFSQAGAYFAAVSVSPTARVDIGLQATADTVDWAVYRDIDGNGSPDAGEGIAGARIQLTDDRGARISLTTNPEGEFTVLLFGNRTYAGSVSAIGYELRNVPSSSPSTLRGLMPIALAPTPVQVQGSVLLNGSAVLNRAVAVRAVALGDGAVAATGTTDSNGGFALGLIPGTYALVVDENVSTTRDWRYQNLGTDRIVLRVGEVGVSRDIAIVARALVQGNVTQGGAPVSASIAFDGPDRAGANATASGFEVYLIPGSYSVTGNRTVGPDEYAFITAATILSPATLSFELTQATRVSGRALFDGEAVPGPMEVDFIRQEGGSLSVATDATGAYGAFLVTGNYTVQLAGAGSSTEGDIVRYFRYAFGGTATIATGQTVLILDLLTARTLDNTTVAGTATRAGIGVEAIVTFTARGGGAISASVVTDSDGTYSVPLAPGTYDAYATRTFGTAAFLARITVPHATAFARDLPLADAFLLSGVTTDPQGARVSASITIQSAVAFDLTSTSNGAYQAVLPRGTYTVSATRAGTENGVPVTYAATRSIALASDTVLNLPLAKVVNRSAALSWDASQRREIPAGASVVYTILVRNTGNVQDTLRLAGRPSDWQFSFTPTSVSLDFGTAPNSAAVRVVIESPARALVDHGPIQIIATSEADGSTVGSVDVIVDIVRVRGLSTSLSSSAAVFDGRFLNYTLLVTNSGNARETVRVTITNPDDLAAAGWSVSLGTLEAPPTGITLTGVEVDANETISLRLRAEPRGGSSGATVVLVVSAQDSMAVSASGVFTLQLPELAPGGVDVTGPEVTRVAPLSLEFIAIAAGAAAAIATGLFLTRRRR